MPESTTWKTVETRKTPSPKAKKFACYICGELGHIQADCPVLCSHCGRSGHAVTRCYQKKKDDAAALAAVQQSPDTPVDGEQPRLAVPSAQQPYARALRANLAPVHTSTSATPKDEFPQLPMRPKTGRLRSRSGPSSQSPPAPVADEIAQSASDVSITSDVGPSTAAAQHKGDETSESASEESRSSLASDSTTQGQDADKPQDQGLALLPESAPAPRSDAPVFSFGFEDADGAASAALTDSVAQLSLSHASSAATAHSTLRATAAEFTPQPQFYIEPMPGPEPLPAFSTDGLYLPEHYVPAPEPADAYSAPPAESYAPADYAAAYPAQPAAYPAGYAAPTFPAAPSSYDYAAAAAAYAQNYSYAQQAFANYAAPQQAAYPAQQPQQAYAPMASYAAPQAAAAPTAYPAGYGSWAQYGASGAQGEWDNVKQRAQDAEYVRQYSEEQQRMQAFHLGRQLAENYLATQAEPRAVAPRQMAFPVVALEPEAAPAPAPSAPRHAHRSPRQRKARRTSNLRHTVTRPASPPRPIVLSIDTDVKSNDALLSPVQRVWGSGGTFQDERPPKPLSPISAA